MARTTENRRKGKGGPVELSVVLKTDSHVEPSWPRDQKWAEMVRATAAARERLDKWLAAQPQDGIQSVIRPPADVEMGTPVFSVYTSEAVADRLLDPHRKPEFVKSAHFPAKLKIDLG